jgi:hypothetical protein
MGLFDRFRRKPGEEDNTEKSFFLEPDKASSLGDVDFMRRSNSIRRTFPGTADNPGTKERIEEVASMENRLQRVSDGLPESQAPDPAAMRIDPGVPKPVKKTFAQTMTQEELQNRIKGTAVTGTNVPGTASKGDVKAPSAPAAPEPKPVSGAPSAKPGSIDPFKEMLRDLR